MFNAGFRGKRASDGTGITNPQDTFIQGKYPVPSVTSWSISGSDDNALDPAGGQTVLVNGGGFVSGCAVTVDGNTISPVTLVSPNQISFTSPAKAGGSYTLIVYNSTGGAAILVPGLIYSSVPTWTTSAGSIGSYYETIAIDETLVATSDSAITYTLASGSLPSGSTLYANGVITGTAPVDSSSTTYTFAVTATDEENQDVTRTFTLTINTDVVTWVTPSSGATFSLDGTAYSQALSATDAAGYSIASYTANALPTGLTLSSGTISGTPTEEGTTSTLLTATAATTGRSAENTITWVVSLSDTYWKYNTLLLTANASSQTNSFVSDASVNNAQLTVVGDTRAQNFNPYQQGFYSVQYNGTVNDYISIPHNSKLSIMSGDTGTFVAECFVYWNTVVANTSILDKSGRNTISFQNWSIELDGSKNIRILWGASGSPGTSGIGILASTTIPTVGKWYHVALVKSNADWSLFINGTRAVTYNGLNTANDANPAALRTGLGILGEANGAYMNGYISNVRVYNGPAGSAPYSATSTTITVPTSPFLNSTYIGAITNQSSRYIDNSSFAATITAGSGVKVASAHPFTTPTTATYNTGYSAIFDGTDDYLTVATSSNMSLTGDFTVEFWIYNSSSWASYSMVGIVGANKSRIYTDSSSILHVYNGAAGTLNWYTAVGDLALNTWYHFAFSRVGSTLKFYINGTSRTMTTASGSVTETIDFNGTMFIGGTSAASVMKAGIISNLRVINGTGLYSANFTPPTSALTAVANTQLLTCQDSTFKDNSTNAYAITSYNQAQPIALSPFTMTTSNTTVTSLGSAYFDGTGDYVSVPYSAAFSLGTTYTIQAWLFPTTLNATNSVFNILNASTTNFGGSLITVSSTGSVYFESRPGNGGTNVQLIGGTVALNTWSHIAVSINATAAKLFVNGIQVATGTVAALDGTQTFVAIGSFTNGYTANPWTGYISDLQVVKGTALYTSNFLPPQAPLTAVTNTQLLTLQYNGGATNNGFVDQSSFNNIITRNGNPTQGTFSPYGDNWSNYFDGSGDYLTVPNNTALQMGSGDFTIEFWINYNSIASYQTPYSKGYTAAGDLLLQTGNGDGKISVWLSGTAVITEASGAVVGQWYHYALVRSGTTVTLYRNGVSVGTATSSVNFNTADQAGIGATGKAPGGNSVGAFAVNGYMSNLRVVKGTAVYTSAFTPPTAPLTAIANTSLLTCQSNRLIDNSPNNLTITKNGDVNIRSFSPFSTVTVPKYYSTYFGTKTDYLSTPAVSGLTTFAGDFTFECWVYPTDTSITYWKIWDSRQNGATANPMVLGLNPLASPVTGQGRLSYFNGTEYFSTGIVNYNQWTHIAYVRIGSTMTYYVNGVAAGTSTISGTQTGNATTNPVWIGTKDNGSAGYGTVGYISNFRIVNGVGVYTGNFTPPTAPLTKTQSAGTNIAAISGSQTVLLTCQDNTIIDNSSNNYVMTSSSTTVKPLPLSPFTPTASSPTSYSPTVFGGSMYFDGTGDYLTSATSTSFAFGTGDFTVEFWFYPSVINLTNNPILDTRTSSGSGSGLLIRVGDGGSSNPTYMYAVVGATTIYQTGLVGSQWQHIAVTRTSNSCKVWINGVAGTAGTSSTDLSNGGFLISKFIDGTNAIKGYLSDFRIIKGVALYTSNFYPGPSPATPTTTIGANTYSSTLLLNGTSGGVIDATRTVDLETVADAKVTNFSPYNGSYYSNYFDGTGDYLTLPSNQTQFTMGTGDFTIEMWVNVSDFSAQRTLYDTMNGGDTGGTGRFALEITTGGVLRVFTTAGTILTSATSVTISAGVWYHIAYVRVSNSGKLYINGNQVNNTYTDNNNYVVGTTSRPIIGINAYDNSSNPMKGYISNLRVVKGSGLYTGAFTPSTTPLTVVSGTSLLTCQSNKFVDNSTNNFTLTRNGDVKVATQNPFQVNTGQSYYFDGTGDYLASTLNQPLNGQYTMEMWVYMTTLAERVLFFFGTFGSDSNRLQLTVRSTGRIDLFEDPAGGAGLYYPQSADGIISTNRWYHVAATYDGTTPRIYVDGTLVASSTYTSTSRYTATGCFIGYGRASSTDRYFPGYISDVRIIRGYARYTSAFTPPTSPHKLN